MDAATAGVIATGAIGLAGIIGTFFSPTWNEQKREAREARRWFRTARRLVGFELNTVGVLLETTKEGLDEESLSVGFDLVEWEAHRQVLAESLPNDVWRDVSHTYAQLELMRGWLHAKLKAGKDLDDEILRALDKDIARCQEARAALETARPLVD